ncbi:MAG: phosphoenolpyruvate synthase [Actinobacteria bacterium]|nr:phosphoenolpyruvate synthase [Actinomycetota bacterium]
MDPLIRQLGDVGMADIEQVGGKNASLGEMISNLAEAGVQVPGGFATTADAFWEFLASNNLDVRINELLDSLDIDDVVALARAGSAIRQWVVEAPLGDRLNREITDAYLAFSPSGDGPVAVRSSATAEDLPDASFAGQQETFLNVVGIEAVLQAIHEVFASLYNDRAISYRVHKGFAHSEVALSAGVQQMVRSDCGSSGVMFTMDTESGHDGVVFITSAYGLGELVVQGAIVPDEFYVFKKALAEGRPAILQRRMGSKHREMVLDGVGVTEQEVSEERRRTFSLTTSEVEELARIAVTIEGHYGRPMDIEWGKDGIDGELYILQARPETVQSQTSANTLERFQLNERGPVLVEGRSVGQRIGSGVVRVIRSPSEMDRVQDGDVLVADMTDPDWEPVMKRASAIVTNRGGRTCHAAIIARELSIPAVVGTGDGTSLLTDGIDVTVSCAEGDTGYVYEGILDHEVLRIELDSMPEPPTEIMMNVASPDRAFSFAQLPNAGVGLARVEFVINNVIGVHPRALLDYPDVPPDVAAQIENRTAGYPDARTFFVDKLREGVATIAAAFAPKPVIVRLSDFKSNEYAHLIGGTSYEPVEENPMIGFRGASRYRSAAFQEAFALECEAIRSVRDDMGLTNVEVMVPFVRTVGEAREVVDILASNGIVRGENGLRLIMMCEIPSNALLADQFLEMFDGFSIGSNDLTQFTLALDRDSGLVAQLFNERDEAVLALISMALDACQRANKYIGICGQGPSDHPDFAQWLSDHGISSISLNPDTVIATWLHLAKIDV